MLRSLQLSIFVPGVHQRGSRGIIPVPLRERGISKLRALATCWEQAKFWDPAHPDNGPVYLVLQVKIILSSDPRVGQ